ncbi:MAG TPA: DUF1552 domain-containing protein, partial [Polyangia bacterium]|nr:DUF1552 domain-containing protein [Polyangia bacterium]
MKSRGLSRRHVLRGAGLALTLPWLESLEPRRARGQSVAPIKRFVPIYFPFGTADHWTPQGTGATWQLSSILEPFTPVKAQVTVLGHVDQTVYGTSSAPGTGPLTGSFLTCAKCATDEGGSLGNDISIDQRIAGGLGLRSLQVGLANTNASSCGGGTCVTSRSISWSGPDAPMYKVISPQNVFDVIVGATMPVDPAAQAHARKSKSIVDFVLGNAGDLSPRLGHTDRARMDQFLTSVRDLELRVAAAAGAPPSTSSASCQTMTRPTFTANNSDGSVPADYDRDAHADIMIDLIVMALSCDAARVVSFMLDDANSSCVYGFLKERAFTTTSSTAGPRAITDTPVSAASAGATSDAWATIDWWYASKVSALCQKLAAISDGPGATLLDNSLVWFGSG